MKRQIKLLSIIFLIPLLLFPLSGEGGAALSTKRQMPELLGVRGWINRETPRKKEFEGKVVLVAFWNLSCVPCLRAIPKLKQWDWEYYEDGFRLITVHTPELDFEKEPERVLDAAKRYRIRYPIAVDSDKNLSVMFGRPDNPTHYLMDSDGRIRFVFGVEDSYEKQESLIRNLIQERDRHLRPPVKTPKYIALPTMPGSPEPIRLGYKYLSSLGNPVRVQADRPQTFKLPDFFQNRHFYLEGSWKIHEEYARLTEAPGAIVIPYHSDAIHLIGGSVTTQSIKGEVFLDGELLTPANAGTDIAMRAKAKEDQAIIKSPEDEKLEETLDDLEIQKKKSYISLKNFRLYSLVEEGPAPQARTLRMHFSEAGVEIYGFAFGGLFKREVVQEGSEKEKEDEEDSFDDDLIQFTKTFT